MDDAIITDPSEHANVHPALENARNAHEELGHAAAKLAKIILMLRRQQQTADIEFVSDLADELAERIADAHIHAECAVDRLKRSRA